MNQRRHRRRQYDPETIDKIDNHRKNPSKFLLGMEEENGSEEKVMDYSSVLDVPDVSQPQSNENPFGSFGGGNPFERRRGNSLGESPFGSRSTPPFERGYRFQNDDSPFGSQMGTQGDTSQNKADFATVAVKFGSSLKEFIKAFMKMYSSKNEEVLDKYAAQIKLYSQITMGIGALGCLFSLLMSRKFPYPLLVVGLALYGISLLYFSNFYDLKYGKAVVEKQEKELEKSLQQELEAKEKLSIFNDFSEDEEVEEEDDFPKPNEPKKPEKGVFGGVFSKPKTVIKTADVNDVAKEMERVGIDLYSRGLLYDKLVSVLPKKNANYADDVKLKTGDARYYELVSFLHQAADVSGLAPEDHPNVISISENMFTISMELERPRTSGIANTLTEEFLKLYKTGGRGREIVKPNASISYNEVGATLWVEVLKGDLVSVMLGDILSTGEVRDKIVNSNEKFPVVLGVSEGGKVHTTSLDYVNSMLIQGASRSGKSVTANAIFTQMLMWNSPKKLRVVIIDAKDTTSDFDGIKGKHLYNFAGNAQDAFTLLEHILEVEVPARNKVLSEHGVIKIEELHEQYPEVEMPYIYIIYDEMKAMNTALEQLDLRQKFDAMLTSVLTTGASRGIRMVFVPHRLHQDNINSNIYTQIENKIGVMSNRGQLEKIIDDNKELKSFGYSLNKPGECVLVFEGINGRTPTYSYTAPVSLKSAEVNRIYDLIAKIWEKEEVSPAPVLKSANEKVDLF